VVAATMATGPNFMPLSWNRPNNADPQILFLWVAGLYEHFNKDMIKNGKRV
jgi:hypothetical protein